MRRTPVIDRLTAGLPVLPILVPLVAAIALLTGPPRVVQRLCSLLSATVALGVGVALVVLTRDGRVIPVQAGGWPAPFGITLVADSLGALMVLIATIIAPGLIFTIAADATTGCPRRLAVPPNRHQLGVRDRDIFNLYVSYEVMLMASYLLTHGRRDVRPARRSVTSPSIWCIDVLPLRRGAYLPAMAR
jgi:formate hydrogenlyase subunit 3/multisubunit Na+/H+ antiporter MnhD subunit